MIGVGKSKRGRRYPYHPIHYACVLCGSECPNEATATACFDRHSDATTDLAQVLHHLFCTGRHCRRKACINPEHCHFRRGWFGSRGLIFITAGCTKAQLRHWQKKACLVKRFAREHGIPTLTFVKFLHNLKT